MNPIDTQVVSFVSLFQLAVWFLQAWLAGPVGSIFTLSLIFLRYGAEAEQRATRLVASLRLAIRWMGGRMLLAGVRQHFPELNDSMFGVKVPAKNARTKEPRPAIWLMVGMALLTILTPLIEGLNLPHALAIGADGMVYVGEMSRIIRFDPHAADPRNTVETVIAGLPDNRLHDNRHPLSKFVFAPDGALLVNVGAPSDQCLDATGKPLGETCPEADSGDRAASLRHYPRTGDGRWSADYTVHAKGLRNSVALAVHPSGKILQGAKTATTSAAVGRRSTKSI